MEQEQKAKSKVEEITEKLEQGIRDLFQSGAFEHYLRTMSKFHNYSFNNTLLIAMQKPEATFVAGYTAWERNFNRHVEKGEQGIKILAPAPYKVEQEVVKKDPITQNVIIGSDGKPVTERIQVTIPAYKVVTVFDVSQTVGEDLPEIAIELRGDVEEYEKFFEAIKQVAPVPVEICKVDGGANGYYHQQEKRIAIREGMSQMQTIKTAIHETAHAILHDKDLKIEEDNLKDRNTKEVEAESIAYTVCQHFGIETSDYSFGYVAGWSSGKELAELKNSMNTIRKAASDIINGIESRLKELSRDKVVVQKIKPDTEEKRMNMGQSHHRSRR